MPLQSKENLRVIIVGAGLGGLLTAILLERAGIDYRVYERASTVKPLGAVLTLNANILPVFKQLGMLDDLCRIALPCKEILTYNRHLEKIGAFGGDEYSKRTGYNTTVFSRPELYDLLLTHIPQHKVLFNKRVLNLKQDEDAVTIVCGDGSESEADIVIGADGAYSAVRQVLFRDLSQQELLPLSDKEDLKTVRIGMYGVTDPLDPLKYPGIFSDTAKFITMTNGESVFITVSLPSNRISWGTGHDAVIEKVQRDKMAASSWGADQAEEMIKEVSHVRLPVGGTMGDLIANTPRDRISKVMLEEKLFETWHHGRVVLLGDACHKMTPGGGQGAVNAMQDAVVLVNMLKNLDDFEPKHLNELFQDYKHERYHQAKAQIEASQKKQSFLFARTKLQEAVRWLLLKAIPSSVFLESMIKDAAYQPQVAFLPLAVGNPNFKPLPQMVLKRYGTRHSVAAASI